MSATQSSQTELASVPAGIETPPPHYWQRWETNSGVGAGAASAATLAADNTPTANSAAVTMEIPSPPVQAPITTSDNLAFHEPGPSLAAFQSSHIQSDSSNTILLNNADLIEYYSEEASADTTTGTQALQSPQPQQAADSAPPPDREIVALVPGLSDTGTQKEKNSTQIEPQFTLSPATEQVPPYAEVAHPAPIPSDTPAHPTPTFTATVPLSSLAPDPNASVSLPSTSESGPPRVLIVEDDRTQALFAQSILLGAGIQSQVQMDASKTIESINSYSPDLVLMDLHMPEMDGMNLTMLIRQQPGFQSLPIILLTGDQNPDLEITALDTGVDDFLNKPIRPRHLIAAVSGRIKRARQQSTKETTPASAPAPARPSRTAATPPKVGLTTRSHLLQLIDEALFRKFPGALLFVELTETATLREQYGYASFERLISETGQQIADFVTPHPLARLSDNGFLILLNAEGIDLDGYAHQLNQRLSSQTFRIRGNDTMQLHSVIGYSSLSQGFNDAGSALEAMERCTLQARNNPDGIARYSPIHLDRKTQQENTVLLEGELELAFQPIIAIGDDKPTQYQTLLRIRKPDGTSLPAGNIIPAAEAAGRIADFDQMVLDRAIAAIAKHRNTIPSLSLFVSQSPRTLARESYADWLLHRISTNNIDSQAVVIDLRLIDALTNTVTVGNFCRRLTAVGIQFCLNQFEPSREANALLQWLPLSFVRLSPQFADVHNNPKLDAELRDLVALAHKHNLQVIGQRVESRQAAVAMQAAGVDFIQGNLFHSVSSDLDFDFQKTAL
ncbi:MAG: EAL domain-containing protein [Xanthomonadaceae bacterium]|nr:EAL domain-containing protein [Xanthomonadaceae bacterium]